MCSESELEDSEKQRLDELPPTPQKTMAVRFSEEGNPWRRSKHTCLQTKNIYELKSTWLEGLEDLMFSYYHFCSTLNVWLKGHRFMTGIRKCAVHFIFRFGDEGTCASVLIQFYWLDSQYQGILFPHVHHRTAVWLLFSACLRQEFNIPVSSTLWTGFFSLQYLAWISHLQRTAFPFWI